MTHTVMNVHKTSVVDVQWMNPNKVRFEHLAKRQVWHNKLPELQMKKKMNCFEINLPNPFDRYDA